MGIFFAELKRRNIYRVGAAYMVVAWGIAQVVDLLSQVFQLASWIAQPALILLTLGLPVVLLATWIWESKPQELLVSAVHAKTGVVDWVLSGALVAVIALMAYRAFDRSAPLPDPQPPAQQTADISLVVLPFDNLSGDKEQEFFSDGITEEITAALAKVPDLRVVARTSAFQFKAQNRDISSIGEQLHASHFIEGSVRKAGNRVRITAQLIGAAKGTHLWAQDFDRELTDIFAVQEDIARAITEALRVPLGLKPGENLITSRSLDPATYDEFLRAKALVLARGQRAAQAVDILEPLVEKHPGYAPAWTQLSFAHTARTRTSRNATLEERKHILEIANAKAEAAAQRAIALDPTLPDAYLALASRMASRGAIAQAEELYSKAFDLDSENSAGLNLYGNFLAMTGKIEMAVGIMRRLRVLEPFVPVYSNNVAQTLWLAQNNDEAIAIFKENTGRLGGGFGEDLARVYASMGRYADAADYVSKLPGPLYPAEMVATATRLLRSAPKKDATPQKLPSLGTLGFIYVHVGAPERALEFYDETAATGFVDVTDVALLWHPSYAPLRKTARFKAYVQKIGLVDYWRAKGWPPFCHATTGEDFDCV